MLRKTCQLRFTATAACLLLLASGGCQRSPSSQELLTPLRAQVEADDGEYNGLMNAYGPPKMTPDGSDFTMTRNLRAIAVPWDQVKIEETGGRTTTHRAVVPKIVRTFIKSGSTAEACAAAQERELTPQNIEVTYEYNTLQNAWAAVR